MNRFTKKPEPARVVGTHAVTATLLNNPKRAVHLYLQQGIEKVPTIANLAKNLGIPINLVSKDALTKQNQNDDSHQGVILLCKPFFYVDLSDELLRSVKTCVLLDSVEDPRNLGRAARSAFAFGADLLIIPKDRSAHVTPAAEKAAVGALSILKVAMVTNLVRAIEQIKDAGIFVVGAAGEAKEACWNKDLRDRIALVIGSEETGLRRLVRENCDALVSIPMSPANMSLNAADAATILLYEINRQRYCQ